MRSLIALSMLAMAGSANAGVLFADNFDAHPTALTVTSLSGWTVSGNVDVVDSGTYGITCDVKCIDLDGTTGPGGIASGWVAFSGGQTITVSYDLSGSQRSSAVDDFYFDISFDAPVDILSLTTLSGFPGAPFVLGDYAGINQIFNQHPVAGSQGFITYALSFTPTQAGQFQLNFRTASGDNIGPVLDNVLVTQAAVPEPATWAMLIAGFGLVGAAARRRRAITA
jgi:hypothetical protein